MEGTHFLGFSFKKQEKKKKKVLGDDWLHGSPDTYSLLANSPANKRIHIEVPFGLGHTYAFT